MQRLLSGYVVRFNLRHRRAGPLFQGRYRAILAEEGEWRTEVNRYIHLNPVRLEALGLGKKRQAEVRRGGGGPVAPGLVRERLERLRQFPWSSYRAYAGYFAGPQLLETRAVLDCYAGRSLKERRKNLRDETESAIREGFNEESLLDGVRYGILLGSQEWVEKVRSWEMSVNSRP